MSRFYRAPVATSVQARQRSATYGGKRVFTVSQREYCGTVAQTNYTLAAATVPVDAILTDTNKTASQYATQVQPLEVKTFTWLSNIAKCFDRYRFNYVRFFYEPSCPTNTDGQVIMAFDSDPADAFLQNGAQKSFDWSQLSRFAGSCHGALWAPHRMAVPCDALSRFVNHTFNDPADRRLCDLGTFILAIDQTKSQVPAGAGTPLIPGQLPFGKLYVEYSCSFFDGEGNTGAGVSNQKGNDFPAGDGCRFSGTTSTSGSNYLASPYTSVGDVPFTLSADGTMQFKSKYQGLVDIVVTGTGITAVAVVGGTDTQVTVIQENLTSTTSGQKSILVQANAPGATLTLKPTLTSSTAWAIRFAPYAYNNA